MDASRAPRGGYAAWLPRYGPQAAAEAPAPHYASAASMAAFALPLGAPAADAETMWQARCMRAVSCSARAACARAAARGSLTRRNVLTDTFSHEQAVLLAACGGDVSSMLTTTMQALPPQPSAAEDAARASAALHAAVASVWLAEASAAARAPPPPPPPPLPPPPMGGMDAQLMMALLREALRPQQALGAAMGGPFAAPQLAPRFAPPPGIRRRKVARCQARGCGRCLGAMLTPAVLTPPQTPFDSFVRWRGAAWCWWTRRRRAATTCATACAKHTCAPRRWWSRAQRSAFARHAGNDAALRSSLSTCARCYSSISPRLTRFPAQKCSRFHGLSAFKGTNRTCAVTLAQQLEQRRSRALAEGRELRTRPRYEHVDVPGATHARGGAAESEEEEEERRLRHASRTERHLEPPAMSPSRTDGSERCGQPSALREALVAPQGAAVRDGSAGRHGAARKTARAA